MLDVVVCDLVVGVSRCVILRTCEVSGRSRAHHADSPPTTRSG